MERPAERPIEEDKTRLASMLRRFLEGEDRSRDFVDQIEGLLVERFRDTEVYGDILSVPVASYSPHGGEYLYDEEALARQFRYALKILGEESQP